MSWYDDIQSYKLIPVTTGDGETYNLKMRFKGGSIDPKTATYTYPGKVGSVPKRNSCSSPIYDLMFFVYQDNWKAFKDSISSPDSEWLVKHPLYGDLKGHPTSMNWDNTKLGDVEFNIQFQQSIPDDFPNVQIDYQSKTRQVNTDLQEKAISNFSDLDVSPGEVSVLSGFIDNLETSYSSVLNNEYINKLYDIRQTINSAEFNSFRFISQTNDLLNIASRLTISNPTQLTQSTTSTVTSVKERLNLIETQNNEVKSIDENDSSDTPDGNKSLVLALFKESAGACNITALTETIITPNESNKDTSGFDVTDTIQTSSDQDYKYKKDVDNVILQVNSIYNSLIDDISQIDLESDNVKKFIPNDDLNNGIDDSVFNGIQEIKEIASNAREENIYNTEYDTVPELLAFKLYGSATEENVNSIINDNDLLGKESIMYNWRNLVIRKNTSIKYYV